MVEFLPSKQAVAGSSPVSRSTFDVFPLHLSLFICFNVDIVYTCGVVHIALNAVDSVAGMCGSFYDGLI